MEYFMDKHAALLKEMTHYYSGDPKRIQHFFKVFSYTCLIAQGEELDEETRFTAETAAIVHDIGIKVSEEKYGDSNGKHQEQEGPDVARPMLGKLGYAPQIIDRVCYLIAHHHTYKNIDGLDYQILVEADFLVNMYEDDLSKKAILSAYKNIFRTESGRALCRDMYHIEASDLIEDKTIAPEIDTLVEMGNAAGFTCTAVVETSQIEFNPDFRICCEDNSCGKYGVNYTCPPHCGTTDEMKERILSHKYAIVFQTMWEIPDTEDAERVKQCKGTHNAMVRKYITELDDDYKTKGGFMVAASGCSLCKECAIVRGEPCVFPDKAASCASAYCIYVEKLAETSGMEYDCGHGIVAFFGMYLFG